MDRRWKSPIHLKSQFGQNELTKSYLNWYIWQIGLDTINIFNHKEEYLLYQARRAHFYGLYENLLQFSYSSLLCFFMNELHRGKIHMGWRLYICNILVLVWMYTSIVNLGFYTPVFYILSIVKLSYWIHNKWW